MKTNLQAIPGVGEKLAAHLEALGYHSVEALAGQNPEELYLRDRIRCGGSLDRCVLYVYRCAVYYAETANPDPEKLKWWNWKDE